ncbi:MAG: asparaginase [Spirochaetales bacterium]|nr:MAG: asparaginase [Spirochaetales bacterium]
MRIRIIITGGTFDKQYDAVRGVLTFKDTHLPEILSRVRLTVPVEMEINQLIDSLDMQDENRRRILASCEACAETRLIITHGTDTMVKTAQYIGAAGLNKTIVLTGAMVPFTVAGSDAMFNLGCAFSAVQVLPVGVYLAMNGRIFTWDNVIKDREEGMFRTVS